MSKRYSEAQKALPPSKRKYVNHMKVPPGCVDIWRINVGRGHTVQLHSQWLDRDFCMEKADILWNEIQTRNYHGNHVYVEHKAAIKIGDKWHIINIPSFKPEDEPMREHMNPLPEEQS